MNSKLLETFPFFSTDLKVLEEERKPWAGFSCCYPRLPEDLPLGLKKPFCRDAEQHKAPMCSVLPQGSSGIASEKTSEVLPWRKHRGMDLNLSPLKTVGSGQWAKWFFSSQDLLLRLWLPKTSCDNYQPNGYPFGTGSLRWIGFETFKIFFRGAQSAQG